MLSYTVFVNLVRVYLSWPEQFIFLEGYIQHYPQRYALIVLTGSFPYTRFCLIIPFLAIMNPSSWKLSIFIISSILSSIISAIPQTLSSGCGWTYVGCVFYQSNGRPLTNRFAPSTVVDTTVENCQAVCSKNGFSYAGMEDGWGCYCGNTFTTPLSLDGYCNSECFGDATEICGGYSSQSIYINTCGVVSSISSSSSSSKCRPVFIPDSTSSRKIHHRFIYKQ